MYIAIGYQYLNPDQVLCVNALLIRISVNWFAVCKTGLRTHSPHKSIPNVIGKNCLVNCHNYYYAIKLAPECAYCD